MCKASHFLRGCVITCASLLPLSGCAADAPSVSPLTAAAPANLSALDFANMWQPGWQCGQETPVSRILVQSLLDKKALYGYALNGIPLPMLLGKDPQQLGSILFVQYQGRWHAWPIAEGGEVLAAYSTPAFNRVMLFATGGRQGPGNHYVVLHGKHQLGEFGCSSISLPAELDRPDWGKQYPAIQAFNMDETGRGLLFTTSAAQSVRAELPQRYQYSTHDWGRSWSEAGQARATSANMTGIFQPISEIPPPPWFVHGLLASDETP